MKRLIFIIAALFATAQSQTIQTIGAPTTTVVSRGNFRTDSIFYLPKRQKLPTDSGAVRYQISDSSVYYWSGFQWLKLGVNIDTSSMLGNYVRGSGTANYLPKFSASRSIIDSKVYETGTNLMFNTTTPYISSSGYGTFDINGSTASVFVLKKSDTARGYWSHNGSTMDINNLSAGDIRFYTQGSLRGRFQTDGTFRLNSLTGTGSRIVVADANGVLSATSSATGLVDTTVVSTRDWRQKGNDSLGAIIATKGSGTVTSVATGYGLSGGTITTTGTIIADSNFVASRLRVGKVVDSLSLVRQNVLTNPVTGTGTSGQVAYFNGTSSITGESAFIWDATNDRLGIGGTPSFNLDILASVPQMRLNSATGTDASVYRAQNSGGTLFIALENSAGTSFSTNAPYSANIYHSGAYPILFHTSATERMRLTSAGELLLNTTTDAGDYKLQVSGNAYVTGTTVLAATSGNVGIGNASPGQRLHIGNNTETSIGLRISPSLVNWDLATNAGGDLAISNGLGTYLQMSRTSATFTLGYSSGGVTTPASLQFENTYPTTDGFDKLKLYFFKDATQSYGIGSGIISDMQYWAGTTSTGAHRFFTSQTERMRLNASGELLLNTTTDAGDYKLQVSGNAYVTGTTVLAASSGDVGIGTTSPISKLDVRQTSGRAFIISGATTSTLYQAYNTSGGNYYIGVSSSTGTGLLSGAAAYSMAIVTESGRDISFGTTNVERIRIYNDGGLRFIGQSAAPTAAAGTVYYDTDDNKLKVYNGTTWVDLH